MPIKRQLIRVSERILSMTNWHDAILVFLVLSAPVSLFWLFAKDTRLVACVSLYHILFMSVALWRSGFWSGTCG